MGLFDLFGKRERSMILDVATMEKWPERLLRQQGLDRTLRGFVQSVEEQKQQLATAKEALKAEEIEQRIPERAQPVYEEHLPVILNAVEDLLMRSVMIEDLFALEKQQKAFQQAMTQYREATQKSVPALKEHMGEELGQLNEQVKELEDAYFSINPSLDEARFADIKGLKEQIEAYRTSRERERKLEAYKERLHKELESLESKKLRHKERIKHYVERAKDSKFQGLIAEEEKLLEQMDRIKVKGLPPKEEEERLAPIKQRLAWLRKTMISDITAMNINEQRTFLEATKDEIRLRRRQLEKVEEALDEISFDTFRVRFAQHLEPFNAKIEDMGTIIEREDVDVAPQ